MTIEERTKFLKQIFEKDINQAIPDSPLEIDFFEFRQQRWMNELEKNQGTYQTIFNSEADNLILENKQFRYPIFRYKNEKKSTSAIVLLHGLNERSWEKYLCWAEYLALHTHKPVIMFPLAFHMNRTPFCWKNPRSLLPWLEEWRKIDNTENLTFANLTLSNRLSISPQRFYTSGSETAYNIWQLVSDIHQGNHSFFEKNTKVDFFAYSIGALLAQVMLMSNPDNLFSTSKLFMFCGGSIFNKMNGNSRYIMDKRAFDSIFDYYQDTFLQQQNLDSDYFIKAFRSMIDFSENRTEREKFFVDASKRIRVIALKKDKVIPIEGIREALGEICADQCLTELDCSVEYSHEMPFPNIKLASDEINNMFNSVFSAASCFLL